ncbi:hypothetical protein IWZ01DRAFT_566758 [Phyllosticta capitalensis]
MTKALTPCGTPDFGSSSTHAAFSSNHFLSCESTTFILHFLLAILPLKSLIAFTPSPPSSHDRQQGILSWQTLDATAGASVRCQARRIRKRNAQPCPSSAKHPRRFANRGRPDATVRLLRLEDEGVCKWKKAAENETQDPRAQSTQSLLERRGTTDGQAARQRRRHHATPPASQPAATASSPSPSAPSRTIDVCRRTDPANRSSRAPSKRARRSRLSPQQTRDACGTDVG